MSENVLTIENATMQFGGAEPGFLCRIAASALGTQIVHKARGIAL